MDRWIGRLGRAAILAAVTSMGLSVALAVFPALTGSLVLTSCSKPADPNRYVPPTLRVSRETVNGIGHLVVEQPIGLCIPRNW